MYADTKPKSRAEAFKEADRFCRHAVSAMSFEDAATAVAKLQAALAVLIPYKDTKPDDD